MTPNATNADDREAMAETIRIALDRTSSWENASQDHRALCRKVADAIIAVGFTRAADKAGQSKKLRSELNAVLAREKFLRDGLAGIATDLAEIRSGLDASIANRPPEPP